MSKTIGIIGGMGPMATCGLMNKVIALTDARCDQEHIHICVDCNTNIPDRTSAILHHGISPVPELVKSGIRLQAMGANVLIMPCNTAHYYYNQIVAYFDIPLLNMPEETAKMLKKNKVKRIGILATDGTIQSGIYEKALNKVGIELVYPSDENQKIIMSVIYDCIKSNQKDLADIPVQAVVDELKTKGADKILLGCTELPIAFSQLDMLDGTIDPSAVLASAAIHFAGGKTIADRV